MPNPWKTRRIASVKFLTYGNDPYPLRIQRLSDTYYKFYAGDLSWFRASLEGVLEKGEGECILKCHATGHDIKFIYEDKCVRLFEGAKGQWSFSTSEVEEILGLIRGLTGKDVTTKKEKDMTNTWKIQFISKPSVLQEQAGAKAAIICELSGIGDDVPTAVADAILGNVEKFKEFIASGKALEVKSCPFGGTA